MRAVLMEVCPPVFMRVVVPVSRSVTDITEGDPYPVSNLHECIRTISARVFSVFHLHLTRSRFARSWARSRETHPSDHME
jgi:hypothetical protein